MRKNEDTNNSETTAIYRIKIFAEKNGNGEMETPHEYILKILYF